MKKMGQCVAAAALLACVSSNGFAQAAGIDCAKPHLPSERAICANGALRALDARAGAYYAMLLEAKPVADSMPYRDFRDGDGQSHRGQHRDAAHRGGHHHEGPRREGQHNDGQRRDGHGHHSAGQPNRSQANRNGTGQAGQSDGSLAVQKSQANRN